MKVGDLVRCKYIDGKPVGIIVSEPRYGINTSTVDVLVNGHVWPFHIQTIEIIK